MDNFNIAKNDIIDQIYILQIKTCYLLELYIQLHGNKTGVYLVSDIKKEFDTIAKNLNKLDIDTASNINIKITS